VIEIPHSYRDCDLDFFLGLFIVFIISVFFIVFVFVTASLFLVFFLLGQVTALFFFVIFRILILR
jgi:hypothetical protein